MSETTFLPAVVKIDIYCLLKLVGKWVCSHISIAFWRWWQLISIELNFRHFSKQFRRFWLADCGQKCTVVRHVRTQVIAIGVVDPRSSSASFNHIFLTANLWIRTSWSVVLISIWYVVLVVVSPTAWYVLSTWDYCFWCYRAIIRMSNPNCRFWCCRSIEFLILLLQLKLYIVLACCLRIVSSSPSQRVVVMKSVPFLQRREKVLDVNECLRCGYIQDLD